MKSILVTCLKDEINLIQASHLIQSLKKENPHAEVSALTFKDLENTSKTLAGAREIFFIDRHKIEHLKSGALYSDAFAINTLSENLEPVLANKWDQVVNFSNDEISAYLIPMLDADKVSGATVSLGGNAVTSDRWAGYRNFFIPAAKQAPIDDITCAHHCAGAPYAREGLKVGLNEDFTMVANQNFARIRASKGEGETMIVGINLSPSLEGEHYKTPFLAELIETLETSAEYKPVLLLRGSREEKALSDELNAQFDNSLISINMDITAMPSVLANLDFLVTQPNATCALADAMETKIIETLNETQNSLLVNEGSFSIREFSSKHTADDVAFLLNLENKTILPVENRNSSNKIFAKVNDDIGLLSTLIRGPIEINDELEYHVSRCYHYALMGYPIDRRLIDNLKANTETKELREFASKAKEEITNIVKTLLATLRSLQNIKQSEKNAPKFVQYLDQLMLFGKEKNIAQAAVCLFEADIENIVFTTADKNLEAIEKCLFTLKGDLQTLTKIFEELLSEPEPRTGYENNLEA